MSAGPETSADQAGGAMVLGLLLVAFQGVGAQQETLLGLSVVFQVAFLPDRVLLPAVAWDVAWLAWRGNQEREEILEGSVVVQPEWVAWVVAEESQGEMVASGGDQVVVEGHPAFLAQALESSVEKVARKDLPASALEVSEAALVPADERPGLADSV